MTPLHAFMVGFSLTTALMLLFILAHWQVERIKRLYRKFSAARTGAPEQANSTRTEGN
jgi:cytochrome oxidase assembly protein ShyY1